MSLEQFTYSYIFKISQSVYYTMNQLRSEERRVGKEC